MIIKIMIMHFGRNFCPNRQCAKVPDSLIDVVPKGFATAIFLRFVQS